MLKALKGAAHNIRAWPIKLIVAQSNFNFYKSVNPDLSFQAKMLRKQFLKKATKGGIAGDTE